MNGTSTTPSTQIQPRQPDAVGSSVAPTLALPTRVFARKEELAEWLGVSLSTVEQWARKRKIPFKKLDRVVLFNIEEVKNALERFTIKAVGD